MYRVFVNNEVLHEPYPAGNKAIAGRLDQYLSEVDRASLTIAPSHTLYQKIHAFTDRVRIVDTDTGENVFVGRVVKVTSKFSGLHTQTIECEDRLAYLHDSTQVWRKVQNITPEQFFRQLIDWHNQQMIDPTKRFTVGRVTVTNSTDNVYRYTEDDKDTFETIKDKLLNRLGGFLCVSGALNHPVIDYLAEVGTTGQTPLKIGLNLQTASRLMDTTKMVTRLVPLGARIEQNHQDQPNGASQPRLNIEQVNGGRRYLDDTELIAKFGIVERPNVWDDVHDVNILKSNGEQWLREQRIALDAWQVKAVDIGLVKPEYTKFAIGNWYTVDDPWLSNRTSIQVVERTINLLNPIDVTLKFGDRRMRLTDLQKAYLDQQAELARKNSKIKENIDAVKKYAETIDNRQKQDTRTIGQKDSEQDKRIQWIYDHWPTPPPTDGVIVDVSEFQKQINWQTVKNNGISLGIIRVQDGEAHEDLTYKTNLAEATRLGINYAVYAFFRGTDIADSKSEARVFFSRTQARVAGKRQPRFYCIDVETSENNDMRGTVSAYMDQLNALGVPNDKIVLYIANHLYTQFNLDVARAGSIWIPAYGSKPSHPYDLHQYTSDGQVYER